MGTTILAVRYKDGVVVAADTRTSVSGYVSNRYASKLTFVLDPEFDSVMLPPTDDFVQPESSADRKDHEEHNELTYSPQNHNYKSPLGYSTCVLCRSGSAADTQYLAGTLQHHLLSRRILHRSFSTVSDAAYLLRSLVFNDSSLSASLICAGYDHELERGIIYSIAPGGSLVEEKEGWTCSGSGSTYILGYIDANYPKHSCNTDGSDKKENMWTEEEAIEFVGNAIELAMKRDGSSGGFVRMFVINNYGKKAFVRLPKKKEKSVCAEGNETKKISDFAPAVRSSQ